MMENVHEVIQLNLDDDLQLELFVASVRMKKKMERELDDHRRRLSEEERALLHWSETDQKKTKQAAADLAWRYLTIKRLERELKKWGSC